MIASKLREPSLARNFITSLPETIPTVAELLGARYTAEYQEAFPDVQPPYLPFGYLALLQLRVPSTRTPSGLLIKPSSEIDTEKVRTQAALVRALGVSCFKDRQTGADWVEGAWYKAGDFIRSPMYGGDRFTVEYMPKMGTTKDSAPVKDTVLFVFIKEADAIGLVTGDPLRIATS